MLRSFGALSLTNSSSMYNSPEVISSNPAIILSVVDLPQPDGPTKTINSLSLICKLKSNTACTPFGYTLLISFNFKVAIYFTSFHFVTRTSIIASPYIKKNVHTAHFFDYKNNK